MRLFGVFPWSVIFPVIAAMGFLCSPVYSREANTELTISSLPSASPGSLGTKTWFKGVSVGEENYMVDLMPVPDGTGRMALVERNGLVRVFPNKEELEPGEIEVFLDLSDRICTAWESGLYSIEFDPNYLGNGYFYVVWVPLDSRCEAYNPSGTWRLSRFTNSDPLGIDVNDASEVVMLEEEQRHFFHKGGAMEFGPDGHLYVSLGDGAHPEAAQDLSNLKGSIIRLDVVSPPEEGAEYAIPPDNPFVGVEGARPEIYAFGFRNPWRMSFDQTTGRLYAGDVGQGKYEEVNWVKPGKNYGWPYFEALDCYVGDDALCASIEHEEPVFYYQHFGGYIAVIGGLTYLGSDIPQLQGRWLFGDITGRMWTFEDGPGGDFSASTLSNNIGFMYTAYGRDADGEVYLLRAFEEESTIEKLIVVEEPSGSDFPWRLSDHPGLYSAGAGEGETLSGVLPYRPSSQLWSDGALKERYLALPGTSTIGFEAGDHWGFPEGTVLVKNFLLPLDDREPVSSAKRIETRLLLQLEGAWHGFSYEWNEEETDAVLLTSEKERSFTRIDESGNSYSYDWYYPSRSDCMACHTAASGRVLGLSTEALNFEFDHGNGDGVRNQLLAMEERELFTSVLPAPPEQLPRMPDYEDAGVVLHDRAAAYLAANCAMCHQPGAPAPTTFDLRWGADLVAELLNEPATRGDFNLPGASVVAPGFPFRSVLHHRIASRDFSVQMPPLATSKVDSEAVALIEEWILSLDTYTAATSWQHYE